MARRKKAVRNHTDYSIETGVEPVYPDNVRRKYPWPYMKPGQSILVSASEGKAAFTAAINWCKRNNPSLTASMETQPDRSVRIWLRSRA